MPLNFPVLDLPDCPETIAFRTVERILRTDPVLDRIVARWYSWVGDAVDTLEPVFATCPSVHLWPIPGPADWEAEGQHRAPLVVGFKLAVAGSDVNQLMNYFGAFRRALWPPGVDSERFTTVRQMVLAAGITRPTLKVSAYGAKLEADNTRILIYEGQLELLLHINTP